MRGSKRSSHAGIEAQQPRTHAHSLTHDMHEGTWLRGVESPRPEPEKCCAVSVVQQPSRIIR